MDRPIVAPSILSADFADLSSGIALAERVGVPWLHLDVMDGRFVPAITFGAKMVADIRKRTSLILDVHLMTVEPERQYEYFVDAGADSITFHAEACVHSHLLLQKIKAAGVKAGISIVPATPVSAIEELLDLVDLVLVMTVNPGAGGQSLIESCLRKVSELRRLRTERHGSWLISMDGGVNLGTLKSIATARPDVLVVGSAFYSSPDPRLELEAIDAAWQGA